MTVKSLPETMPAGIKLRTFLSILGWLLAFPEDHVLWEAGFPEDRIVHQFVFQSLDNWFGDSTSFSRD